jgi:Ca2+-binding RTX toxin-like protein
MTRRRHWLTLAFAVPMVLAPAGTVLASKPVLTCLGERATIVGTANAETLRGTSGPDVIVGGGGDRGDGTGDVIYGLGGDDRICGNPSEAVDTQFFGGPGDDQIVGTAWMQGGPGDDQLAEPLPIGAVPALVGGPGDDVLVSRGTDVSFFLPGPGDDVLHAAPAGRLLFNVADFRNASHPIVADVGIGTAVGQGHDTLVNINDVFGSRHGDVIVGDSGPNYFHGRGGNDVLLMRGGSRDAGEGGPGADLLDSGAGNDFLAGGRGRDTLFGRAGDDRLLEKPRPEPNLILAGPGNDACVGGYRVPPNVERGCESHAGSAKRQVVAQLLVRGEQR